VKSNLRHRPASTAQPQSSLLRHLRVCVCVCVRVRGTIRAPRINSPPLTGDPSTPRPLRPSSASSASSASSSVIYVQEEFCAFPGDICAHEIHLPVGRQGKVESSARYGCPEALAFPASPSPPLPLRSFSAIGPPTGTVTASLLTFIQRSKFPFSVGALPLWVARFRAAGPRRRAVTGFSDNSQTARQRARGRKPPPTLADVI
jgi:hypothetical protein